MQILTKRRTGPITCLSFSRSHEIRHTGVSFYQFRSCFLHIVREAPRCLTKSPEKFRECPDGTIICPGGRHLRRQHGPASGSPSGPGILGPAGGHPGEKHIIIDLKQQKVFYYVGTTLVGVSPCLPARKVTALPGEHTKSSERRQLQIRHIRRSAQQIHRSRRQQGLQRQGWRSAGRNLLRPRPPCPTGCGLREATACMWVLSPDIRSATAACACRRTWPRHSLNTLPSAPRSPSVSRFLRGIAPQKCHTFRKPACFVFPPSGSVPC